MATLSFLERTINNYTHVKEKALALTRVQNYQVTTDIDTIDDPIITINAKQQGDNTADIGFVMNRGIEDNVAMLWNEQSNMFKFLFTTDSGKNKNPHVVHSGNAPVLTGNQFVSTGNFAVEGDAQAGVYMQRNETTGLAVTQLYSNGVDQNLVVGENSVWTYEILLAAKRIDDGFDAASFKIVGAIARNIELNSVALIGTPSITVIGKTDEGWGAAVEADTETGSLVIKVHGSLGKTVRWVAKIMTLEVAFF